MLSKKDDYSFERREESRKSFRVKSVRINKDRIEINNNNIKMELKNSVETDTSKVNHLLKIRSSKSVIFNVEESKNKNTKGYNEELIPEIIDPSYNFALNYQLKETAINVLKHGIDKDKTKIKFFSNYLYQLSPFNKIFSKLRYSKNILDMYNLQKILYCLSNELNYEYFEKNKIIYKNGDIPDKYYILLKGEVDIIVPNEIEVMMTEFEYYFYILRLYRFQEHSLLQKVLNKNYNLYPLNKKLLEDWIHTAFNTLRHLEQESQTNRTVRKRKNVKKYITSYKNAEDLFNQLEKQKKLNLLMKNKNVIILLEKIRMRNERLREASKNGWSTKKNKNKKKNKNNKNNNEENGFQPIKQNIGYAKLDGQLKKIFMNDEQIEVAEKCANEVSQIIEILGENFNMRKYLNELNRCNSEKYLMRIEPYFFDEDTNEKLDSKLFIISQNADNPQKENKNEEKLIDTDDIRIKLQNLFYKGKKNNKNKMKNSFFANRKKTIVCHYVLVNTLCSGEGFGEMSNESIKRSSKKDDKINLRIATIIPRENSHLASLKKFQYNKILKEINENNLYQQLTFLFSLDIFKECNKNNFMKNYINFFIKKVYRANEIVFSQEEDLGEDRSIYFIEEGSFSSYCNMSVNDIEILFNNLHYDGLIPEDDAHEDNLFNKENHYFNKFKNKKIVFNFLYFTKNDIIGFNDALYNGKYIYTVKCQSAIATVYEIKLKFFNLIVNSEPKLFQNVIHFEMVKRNLMIKFLLNSFNNKNNFYKFISFQNDENGKEDKNIVHKNYFGKNPFRDSNETNNNVSDKKNKSKLKKLSTIQNKINDEFLTLFPKTDRITSPSIKNFNLHNALSMPLNLSNRNISGLTLRNKTILRNRSKTSMKNYIKINKICNTSRNKNNYINSKEYKTEYIEKYNSKKQMNKLKIFNYKEKLDNNDEKDNSFELKIEEYQSKPKSKIVIPPIITNQINKDIHLNNKNKYLYSSLFSDNQENKNKLFINNPKIESSFRSSNFAENISKYNSLKTESKSMNKFKKYLESIENNVTLKNNDISKNEEIQLKCYLKDIPDFFNKNNCKKNIFFGMNKKALFQKNALFTEFK